MPSEVEMLRGYPYAREKCRKCGTLFPEFMRGEVQSAIRRFLGMAYCAIICHQCKRVIGWEKP